MNQQDHLQQLSDIKSIMERSTKFISLSGLSGIGAGIVALLGAAVAYYRVNYFADVNRAVRYNDSIILDMSSEAAIDLFLLATIILVVAVAVGYFFTKRKADKSGETIWNTTSKRLLTSLMIPLVSGGLFCLLMLHHQEYWLVAPATLVFYGLGCVNASQHTVTDIKYLGLINIALGLINIFFIGYGLVFWAIGFGIMHIVYGSLMYFKYEK